jgi:hypothetical protein
MASIGKVKHTPKSGIWVWLGDLEKWKVWRIRGWKGELVYGRDYASIGDRPFEIARRFAAYNARRSTARPMPRVRGRCLGCRIIGARREQLGNAKVALGRGCQQVVLRILRTKHEPGGEEMTAKTHKICVQIGIEDIGRLTYRESDESE